MCAKALSEAEQRAVTADERCNMRVCMDSAHVITTYEMRIHVRVQIKQSSVQTLMLTLIAGSCACGQYTCASEWVEESLA